MGITNTSSILTATSEASPVTLNAGFTFTAARQGVQTLEHYSAEGSITGVSIGGSAATKVAERTDGLGISVEVWWASSMVGGTANVVVTCTGNGNYLQCAVEESDDITAFDQTGNNAQSGTTAPTVTSAATTQSSERVYAVVAGDSNSLDASFNFTTATIDGSAGTSLFVAQDGATHIAGQGTRRDIDSGTGAKTATWACDSNGVITCIATFKTGAAPVGKKSSVAQNAYTGLGI